MNLRPYQTAPVIFLATRKRALVEAPAGSGKTIIAAAAIARALDARLRTESVHIGWIANTTEQCAQARSAMALFPTIAAKARVSVACAAAGHDWTGYQLLVVDEAHHAAAPGWRRQIETCQGARWGLTATPEAEGEDADERDKVMHELFGEEWFVVSRESVKETLSKGRVALLDPVCVPGIKEKIDAESNRNYAIRARRWGGDLAKLRAMTLWQACVDHGIVGNRLRTLKAEQLANLHVAEDKSVLVLVNQVEHAKAVAENITGAVACYSGMGAKARRHALYDFKQGKLKCIVATSLADEGLDVPRASVLVLVSGGRNRAKAEQRTGRVLRQFAGKDHALIYDFEDSFHPLMRKHSLARQEVYAKLGYEVTRA